MIPMKCQAVALKNKKKHILSMLPETILNGTLWFIVIDIMCHNLLVMLL